MYLQEMAGKSEKGVPEQVDNEPTPLLVIPSEAWTQPHGTELYGWVASEVLGLPVSWRLFFFSFKLTAPKNGNMDDSSRGFLSFRAHGKMKIFEFSDESSNFKEMYFKISRALGIQPFYLSSEKKAKFNLHWHMGYRSPRPEANALSEEEKKAASLLRSVWGKEHLNLKDLMCDDEIAKRMAVEMAGGLDALIALRRRLVTKQQILGNKEASSSATVDLTGVTPVTGRPVEPDQSEEKVPSPQSSPAKKRKRVPREVAEEFGTSVNALEKGFNPVLFVDQYLMTQEAEEALEGIEAVDSTIRIQRMVLRAVVHYRDVQKEVAGIPKFQNMLSEKANRIKTLGSRVTDLEAEVKFRGAEVLRLEGVEKTLDEKLKAAEKKAIELQASLKKAQEDLASMEKAKVEAEMSALTAVADIEKTMLEQVSLLAPGTDFSKVSAYNKVVDGQIVDALDNE
ncbi:hypothetical protein PIB30_071882 [Stylosanthes scabra]|uniref:Uncharacterized protein n=1 Tax=Stylosanthes scabra TaxID=79078 RepID=A0ABU6VMA8_9FABA|nr:hypothetical protein [Stylosanthes scabra]